MLLNSDFSNDGIKKAQISLEKDFQPISDMRSEQRLSYGNCKKFIIKMFCRN